MSVMSVCVGMVGVVGKELCLVCALRGRWWRRWSVGATVSACVDVIVGKGAVAQAFVGESCRRWGEGGVGVNVCGDGILMGLQEDVSESRSSTETGDGRWKDVRATAGVVVLELVVEVGCSGSGAGCEARETLKIMLSIMISYA